MTEEKLVKPKYTIEPTAPQYDFGFIAAHLGIIPLPEGIGLRPEAIILMEDGVFTESEEGEPETEPMTLIHLSNQHSIELNAEQMCALEKFIRAAQKMIADAQRDRALMNARAQSGNADEARRIALKAGLIKPAR